MSNLDLLVINLFLQEVINFNQVRNYYLEKDKQQSALYLRGVVELLHQYKPTPQDVVDLLEKNSALSKKWTPSVMLMKSTKMNELYKVISLPRNEIEKTLSVMLFLLRDLYHKIRSTESNRHDKWWYQDLTDNKNLYSICNMLNINHKEVELIISYPSKTN